jgi:hypothetical protein
LLLSAQSWFKLFFQFYLFHHFHAKAGFKLFFQFGSGRLWKGRSGDQHTTRQNQLALIIIGFEPQGRKKSNE